MNGLAPIILSGWMADGGKLQLLDVRELEEWEWVRLPAAVWLPLGRLSQDWGSLAWDPHIRTVAYCHHGLRSAIACGILQDAGFSDLYNLEGGIDRWSCEVDASFRRY
jgi:rhodanese-related sulfurtransferase